MHSTVEITLYPSAEDYLPPIESFIDRINSYDHFQIQTTPTATIICGEHNALMDMISVATLNHRQEIGLGFFVMKLLPGYEAI
jgi:uncharacterized protein YqgV (UPF0045/DUF77 family)